MYSKLYSLINLSSIALHFLHFRMEICYVIWDFIIPFFLLEITLLTVKFYIYKSFSLKIFIIVQKPIFLYYTCCFRCLILMDTYIYKKNTWLTTINRISNNKSIRRNYWISQYNTIFTYYASSSLIFINKKLLWHNFFQ